MPQQRVYTRADLVNFMPQHPTFVGIDSDGCVFDTMEIKQKKCFHTLIVSHWKLEPIEKFVREAAEFVNLYSRWRGENRFPALVRTFMLLRQRPEVKASGIALPEFPATERWIASGAALGNPELRRLVAETGDTELASVLQWSLDVNALIAKTVKRIPPFKWVRESLECIRLTSDAICVSQTPTEALVREWQEHKLTDFVAVIAGQELGSKTEHLTLAAKGKYPAGKILMIGDALGDLKAAKANGALFYPINPAGEEASWKRFLNEAYPRFLAGSYAGEYAHECIAEFDALLPDSPRWRR